MFDDATRRLAEYAVSVRGAPPAAAVAGAVTRHLIDAVACALGALESRPARVARELAAEAASARGASVFGLRQPTTPEYATFANTAMIRFLDFNDTGHGGHPSDTIAAVLALAEGRRASGPTVIRAIHAAYETYAGIRRGGLHGDMLRRRHVDQIYASLGAVIGAGVVLGLDAAGMANAIALALTPNVPLRVTRTGVISDWKGCATAQAAMSSVFAARLAERGLTGPPRPFEGSGGLCDLLAIGPLDLARLGEPSAGRCAVESTSLKFFPAEYSAQGPLHSALALRDRLRLDEIERITVSLHWSGWHEIGGGSGDSADKWNPVTREAADHSMPYLIAVALADGELTVDSCATERLADPALRDLMRKIVVRHDPELTRRHGGEVPLWPSRLGIELSDGRRLGVEAGPPKGHPLNPMSDAELEDKYWRLAERALPRRSAERLLDTMQSLERLADIGELTARFRDCGDSGKLD